MQNDDGKKKTHHSLKSIPRFDHKISIRPPNHKGVKSAKLLKKFELNWKTLFAKPLNKWNQNESNPLNEKLNDSRLKKIFLSEGLTTGKLKHK